MKKTNDEGKLAREAAYSLKGAKIALVAICLVLVLSIGVGITLAILTDGPAQVVNTFTPGKLVIDVHETFNEVQKTNVKIFNDQPNGSNVDSFIRVALVFNWVDDDGNVVGGGTPQSGTDYTIDRNFGSGKPWFLGSDGYYYCRAQTAPNAETAVRINSCSVVTTSANGQRYRLSVDILAQGIQAEPMPSGVWPVTWNESAGTIS